MNGHEMILMIELALRDGLTERSVDFRIENVANVLHVRLTNHNGERKYYVIEIRDALQQLGRILRENEEE